MCRRRCADATAAQCCGSGAPTLVHFSPCKRNGEEVRICGYETRANAQHVGLVFLGPKNVVHFSIYAIEWNAIERNATHTPPGFLKATRAPLVGFFVYRWLTSKKLSSDSDESSRTLEVPEKPRRGSQGLID